MTVTLKVGVACLAAVALLTSGADAQVFAAGHVGLLDRRLVDGGPLERQQGWIGGVSVGATAGIVGVTLGGESGTLAAKTSATPDVDYAAVAFELVVTPARTVALRGGLAAHAYVSPAGTQRWVLPQFGVELRAPFRSVPGEARLGLSLIAGGSTTGLVRPEGGAVLRAGLVMGEGWIRGFADYRFERLNFADAAGRQEERSVLVAGLRIGK